MSKLSYEDAYQVGATGKTVTSSGSSQSQAIPNAADGGRARFVRLMVTNNLYVKFGNGTVVCTTDDMLLSPNFDVIVSCHQFNQIGYLQETASAKLNITPLEC